MKRLTVLMKENDIGEVLSLLTAGLPDKKYRRLLSKYYSIYCLLMETTYFNKNNDVIITRFKCEELDLGNPIYQFYGIIDYPKAEALVEEAINWGDVLEGKAEVLVPKCLLEGIEEENFLAAVLQQIHLACPKNLPEKEDEELFTFLDETRINEENPVALLNDVLEKYTNDLVDRKTVTNAVLEYREKKGIIIDWADILREGDDSFVESMLKNKKDRKAFLELLEDGQLSYMISSAYYHFVHMDPENPPDIAKLCEEKVWYRNIYSGLRLEDYKKVRKSHTRIVIDKNPFCEHLPMVFVRDGNGEMKDFKGINISQFLCMDIRVTENVSIPDSGYVLALIFFYRLYPLHMKRLQQGAMTQAILKIVRDKKSREE